MFITFYYADANCGPKRRATNLPKKQAPTKTLVQEMDTNVVGAHVKSKNNSATPARPPVESKNNSATPVVPPVECQNNSSTPAGPGAVDASQTDVVVSQSSMPEDQHVATPGDIRPGVSEDKKVESVTPDSTTLGEEPQLATMLLKRIEFRTPASVTGKPRQRSKTMQGLHVGSAKRTPRNNRSSLVLRTLSPEEGLVYVLDVCSNKFVNSASLNHFAKEAPIIHVHV